MLNQELENEIEMRLNPEDFSLTSGELIDIMNMFDLDEHDVALAYSKVVEEKREEIKDIVKDVADYFRSKDNFYPSFREFKKVFDEYGQYVNDNILRDMFNKEIKDANQMSIFEIRKMIQEELSGIREDEEFERDAEKIMKQWGGPIEKDQSAKLSPEDFEDIVDAGAIARGEIEAEFGEDEFSPMGDDEYKNIMGIDEAEDDAMGPHKLFRVNDANGNSIKRLAMVQPVEGVEKRGRVKGFGDDGAGNMVIIVDWQFPTDMKFTNPEEMGEDRVAPESIVVTSPMNENGGNLRSVEVTYEDGTVIPTSMAAHLTDEEIYDYFAVGKKFNIGNVEDNMQAVKSVNIIKEMKELNENEAVMAKAGLHNAIMEYHNMGGTKEEVMAIVDTVFGLEEVRGLSHTVKNNGDRNVKKDDKDHSHAPVTTLPEGKTLDSKIKTLSEGSVKRKDLLNFINEEAKNFVESINKHK